MDRIERLLQQMARPGVVLRIAALSICLLELIAAGAALAGRRTDAYDGILPNLYRRLGGASDDLGLLLACLTLLALFAYGCWRLTAQAGDTPPRHALAGLIGLNALALAVTPGLPFLVTALATVQLRSRQALIFGLGQVGIGLLLYLVLPSDSQRAELLSSELPVWVNAMSQLMALVALHGLAFGLGRMAAAETEKRRWLQAMLAERMSAEQWQAEQMRYAERQLMARELHDVVGHHLTALNLHLQVGSALLRRDDAAAAAQSVAKAQQGAAALLADVRAAVSAERNAQRIDLSSALEALAAGISHPRIQLDIAPAARDLGPRTAHALLRCVQEAVTNSVRHSHASEIRICLSAPSAEAVRVSVEDNGQGPRVLQPGNGLKGMAERMNELGGSMGTRSLQPGFAIELQCPRTA